MNLLIGDSHSEHMNIKGLEHFLCSAGSAKGLNNPNSISQYYTKILDKVNTTTYKNIYFMFGGVDIDFSFIHKYLENKTIDYKDFNLNVIKHYLDFITKYFNNTNVNILSVGLPCLGDTHLKKGLLNAHINYLENQELIALEEKIRITKLPNIYDRTKMTLHFNEELEKAIIRLNSPNIKYIDITTFTYSTESHRIKDEFFSRNNHHNYTRNKYISKIIESSLI
jgi:hypothetical protein